MLFAVPSHNGLRSWKEKMADQYNFSLTTFSPTGKLVQIEYALKAVLSGQMCVGIRSNEGVVLVAEKKPSSLLVDKKSISKVSIVGPGLAIGYSGMGPDARVLVSKARKSAQKYLQIHGEWPRAFQLVKELAMVVQEATQSGGVRPFGVSLLVVGYDGCRPALYQIDPSGSYWAWKACAIGKNMVETRKFLEKRFQEDLSLEDAIHVGVLALKNGVDGNLTADSIEIAVVANTPISARNSLLPEFQGKNNIPQISLLTESEIADYISNA